jgi:RNA polymerase sigma-70 factor, ECF subfamily
MIVHDDPDLARNDLEAGLASFLDLGAGLADVQRRHSRACPAAQPDPQGRDARRPAGENLDRLADLACAGDRVALGRLLEELRPVVLRYCRVRLGGHGAGRPAVEDLVKDVLLAVCGALPRYRDSGASLMAFVYGIASHKIVDELGARSRSTQRTGPDFMAILTSEASELRELRALLDELPDKQRGVLVLRIAMGFTPEETARIVGSTPGAVRVAQHRALMRLRALLEDGP